jgi:hypothetical protein
MTEEQQALLAMAARLSALGQELARLRQALGQAVEQLERLDARTGQLLADRACEQERIGAVLAVDAMLEQAARRRRLWPATPAAGLEEAEERELD